MQIIQKEPLLTQNQNKKQEYWKGFQEWVNGRWISSIKQALKKPFKKNGYDLMRNKQRFKLEKINKFNPSYILRFCQQLNIKSKGMKNFEAIPIILVNGYLQKMQEKYRIDNSKENDKEVFNQMQKNVPSSKIYCECLEESLTKGFTLQQAKQNVRKDMDFLKYVFGKISQDQDKQWFQEKNKKDFKGNNKQKSDWLKRLLQIKQNLLNGDKNSPIQYFSAAVQKQEYQTADRRRQTKILNDKFQSTLAHQLLQNCQSGETNEVKSEKGDDQLHKSSEPNPYNDEKEKQQDSEIYLNKLFQQKNENSTDDSEHENNQQSKRSPSEKSTIQSTSINKSYQIKSDCAQNLQNNLNCTGYLSDQTHSLTGQEILLREISCYQLTSSEMSLHNLRQLVSNFQVQRSQGQFHSELDLQPIGLDLIERYQSQNTHCTSLIALEQMIQYDYSSPKRQIQSKKCSQGRKKRKQSSQYYSEQKIEILNSFDQLIDD